MIKKNDIILLTAAIFFGIAIILLINITKTDGSKVRVYKNQKVYMTLDLNKDTTFTVKGEDGSFNTFEIKDGYVKMIDASCPDKLCVHHKAIHYNHEQIVCLPNKVCLEIINGEESQVDSVAN
jgi:hypothetical protein